MTEFKKNWKKGEPLPHGWVEDVERRLRRLDCITGTGGVTVHKAATGIHLRGSQEKTVPIAVAHISLGSDLAGGPWDNIIYGWPSSPPGYTNPNLTLGRARIYNPILQNDGHYKYEEITKDTTNGDVVINNGPWTTSSAYLYVVRQIDNTNVWVLMEGQNIAPYYEAGAYTVGTGNKVYWYLDPALPAGEVHLNHGRYCHIVNNSGDTGIIRFDVGDQQSGYNSWVYRITAHLMVSATISSTAANVASSVQAITTPGWSDFSNLSYYSKDAIQREHTISFLAPMAKNDELYITATVTGGSSVGCLGRLQIIPVV